MQSVKTTYGCSHVYKTICPYQHINNRQKCFSWATQFLWAYWDQRDNFNNYPYYSYTIHFHHANAEIIICDPTVEHEINVSMSGVNMMSFFYRTMKYFGKLIFYLIPFSEGNIQE